VVKRAVTAVLVASLALAATPIRSWSHPLHTTLAEAGLGADGSLQITLRAFADDFSAAVARHAGKPKPADFSVPDADVAMYVKATIDVQDARGRSIPLVWASTRRQGDLVWVTVRVPGVRSLSGVRMTYCTLFDAFKDQVNIVQANDNGRRHTVLFTASDGRSSKPIL